MRRAMLELVKFPANESRHDEAMAMRDQLTFAGGDLWRLLWRERHKVFVLEAGQYLWLSDAPGPRPGVIMLADEQGRRQCPGCYGDGLYRDFRDGFAPCTLCHSSGSLAVRLPACCREEPAHVD